MELTKKELQVAEMIKEVMNDYCDGFSDVMTDDIVSETGLDITTVKGVLGSLAKKKIVGFDDVNGDCFVYRLTLKGFQALGELPDYHDELLD